jgi:CTD kinase subunit alpha
MCHAGRSSAWQLINIRWLSPAAKDLAEGLLHFDPKKRLSATAALRTAYFTSEDPPMEMPTK